MPRHGRRPLAFWLLASFFALFVLLWAVGLLLLDLALSRRSARPLLAASAVSVVLLVAFVVPRFAVCNSAGGCSGVCNVACLYSPCTRTGKSQLRAVP